MAKTDGAKVAQGASILDVSVDGNVLVVRLGMQAPTASASGKTRVVATTHGNVPTSVLVDGKPVIVGVNAYVRA